MSKEKAPRYRFEKYLQVPANFRQLILEKNLSRGEILTFLQSCEETVGKWQQVARLSNTDIAANNRISERSAARARTLAPHPPPRPWRCPVSEFPYGFAALRRFRERRWQVECPAGPVQADTDDDRGIVPEDDDGHDFDDLFDAWVDFKMEVPG